MKAKDYVSFFNWYFEKNPMDSDGRFDVDKYSKALVEAADKYYRDRRDNYCAFCGVVLSDQDKRDTAPDHFHRMCKTHRPYAHYFQLDILAERENVPKPFKLEGFFGTE